MKLDTHPVTGEPREYLTFTGKRPRLDDPAAIARRRRYRHNKTKKQRIRCLHCNKRFTPKRSTRKFCRPICRNSYNIQEHKMFTQNNIYSEYYSLLEVIRLNREPIEVYRELLEKRLHSKIRR